MPPLRKPMRYAHSDGHTDLCFDDSGRYMLTGGSDGDVRIWEGIEDDDTQSHRVGDGVSAIAFKNDRFFTASDSNSIQAHTFPDGAPDGIITRFTAPVNHIIFNRSGSTLVAGASDFTIKIVDVESSAHKVCRGHEAPVLSVAVDPQNEYMASSSCDGSVKVWKMSDQSILKSWILLPKCSDTSLSKTLCRLQWETSKGQYLLVPVEKCVYVYERNTWNKVTELTHSSITQVISVLAFSADSKYFAVACTNGQISVFDWQKRQCVQSLKHEKGLGITALAWNPQGNGELAYCDNQGQLGLYEDVLSDIDVSKQEVGVDSEMAAQGIFDDDDDDMMLTANDADIDVDSDEDISKIKEKVTRMVTGQNGIDDDDSLQFPPQSNDGDMDIKSVSDGIPSRSEPVVERYKTTPLQRPFQSASTPQHLTSRFMKWNAVGIIRQYNSDEENSIDIEFHDSSVHHAMHISNNYNYCLADLSTEAVILANESEDDNPSKLTCMHFGSWDSAKEWSISMPDGEEIKALAVGEGWCALATDQRNVRVISNGGIQKEIFTIAGPVVCMAAHGNQLIIVYHRGTGIPGDQCLGVSLLYVSGRKKCVLNGEPLPLSPESTLSWLGFSAEGTPFYMDSAGLVRMFNRRFGSSWIQVVNTKSHIKGKSDNYWIVGVHENPQQLRCVPCKGSKYPPTLPRPAIAILPFQIPYCEMNTEKSQYEETLHRSLLFSNHFDHWTSQGYEYEAAFKAEALKPTQEALMKLFALSARSEREFRALEVCEMMEDQYTLQLAIKYASRLKHMHLAERISELAQRRLEEATVEEPEEEEEYETETYTRKHSDWRVKNSTKFTNGASEQEDDNDECLEAETEIDNHNVGGISNGETPTGFGSSSEIKPSKLARSTPTGLTKSNPFRVSSSQKKNTNVKGTEVFDSLQKKKSKTETPSQSIYVSNKTNISKSSGKKIGMQTKLFQSKSSDTNKTSNAAKPENKDFSQKPTNAFDIWMSEHKEELKEGNPDIDDDELVRLATDRFRNVPKEERQKYLQRAKELKEKANEMDGDSKKRKREDDDGNDGRNSKVKAAENKNCKPLSEKTSSKLAGFAFQND